MIHKQKLKHRYTCNKGSFYQQVNDHDLMGLQWATPQDQQAEIDQQQILEDEQAQFDQEMMMNHLQVQADQQVIEIGEDAHNFSDANE